MARIKYYYDTETCRYERIKTTRWDIILNLLGFLSVTLILAVVILFTYSHYFDTPKEAQLKKENEELQFYYDVMDKEMKDMQKMVASLQDRDDHIYRVIFEADPIPSTIRRAGIGGSERYKKIIDSDVERKDLILGMFHKIDKLKKEVYIQSKSYDEILEMAKNKSDMLARIPAIQPIPNKQLTRLASGFGIRMHPILKVKKMHWGIDFAAPRGTPIYATGNGTVLLTQHHYHGYGNMVIIDNGYGYQTRFAHMQKYIVSPGEKVKRGQLIGYVGSTGLSTGPHLHYEVVKDGKRVNPIYYFYQDVNDEEYQKLLELASRENQSMG